MLRSGKSVSVALARITGRSYRLRRFKRPVAAAIKLVIAVAIRSHVSGVLVIGREGVDP